MRDFRLYNTHLNNQNVCCFSENILHKCREAFKLVQDRTIREFLKTGRIIFARKVIWNEWLSFHKQCEGKSGLIIFSRHLFGSFSNLAEWRRKGIIYISATHKTATGIVMSDETCILLFWEPVWYAEWILWQ